MAQRIIDVHTHVFPDNLAARAVKQLIGNSDEIAFTDGTVGGLKASMRKNGVEVSVTQPVSTKATQIGPINAFSAGQLKDPALIPFGSLHPDYEEFEEEVGRLKAAGIRGVKFHPDYQSFYVDEERVFPIYQALSDAGLMILFHAGVDIGLGPPYHCPPDRLARVLDAFPKLTVIAAHFGGFQMWDDVDRYLVGRELYLETSYTLAWLDHAEFVRMARAHGLGRVMFGTDSPWADQGVEIDLIRKTGLTDDELDQVFSRTAAKLFNLG